MRTIWKMPSGVSSARRAPIAEPASAPMTAGIARFQLDEASAHEAKCRGRRADRARELVRGDRRVGGQACEQVRGERDESSAASDGIDDARKEYERADYDERDRVHGGLTVGGVRRANRGAVPDGSDRMRCRRASKQARASVGCRGSPAHSIAAAMRWTASNGVVATGALRRQALIIGQDGCAAVARRLRGSCVESCKRWLRGAAARELRERCAKRLPSWRNAWPAPSVHPPIDSCARKFAQARMIGVGFVRFRSKGDQCWIQSRSAL